MMDWRVATTIVGLCTLFIVILLDMLARTFSLQALSLWVKSEYAQVGVTFLIIIFAASLESVGFGVMTDITSQVSLASGNLPLNSLTASEFGDPFKIAKLYLKDTVIACQARLYYVLFAIAQFVEPASTFSLDVRGVESIASGYMLGGVVSSIHYLANGTVYLAVFEYVQYYLLTFAQYTMLAVFLPIGLLLRAFPITRGAGGLIVAFALGFAFVFPVTYILVIAVMPNINSACSTVPVPVLGEELPCYFNPGEIEENVYYIQTKSGDINNQVEQISTRLSLMYLQAFFYPMISLIVTFTFIRQTGSLFGADLAEIGRGIIKIL